MVFYGGLILSVITGIVYLKAKGIPILKIGDLVAPGIMLGEVFGRLGCFLNGCCYGALSDTPWAVCFPALQDDLPRRHLRASRSVRGFLS